MHDVFGEIWITHSGRIFSSPDKTESSTYDANKAKKIVVDDAKPGQNTHTPTLDAEMAKDVTELMRYINKSDYKIIDQLSQTPAKI